MDKILVDRAALQEVILALLGPPHLIRELQAIRNIQGAESPINKLIADYNMGTR